MRPFDPDRVGLQHNVDPRTLWCGNRFTLERRRLALIRGPIDHPVKVMQDGRLTDGHHRTRVAIMRGQSIDVIVQPGTLKTDTPARRLDELPMV